MHRGSGTCFCARSLRDRINLLASFWSGSIARLLATPPAEITGALAVAQIRHFRINETQQLRAWENSLAILCRALAPLPEAAGWHIALEYPLLRLAKRPDAILLTDRAILVLEFKAEATGFVPADRRQVEDYAIDLHDFHAESRVHPIIPILVAEHAPDAGVLLPMLLGGCVAPVIDASAATLSALLSVLQARLPRPSVPFDHAAWLNAEYRPVPNIVDAACLLYAKHGVAEIRSARSDATNLAATTDAILAEIAAARAAERRLILFVTGIPGAGKTLCGLNTVFGAADAGRGTYLTGNPTLVHVLREALTRDAIAFGAQKSDAARKMKSAIQRLPDFRNAYVANPDHVPPEQIVIIDEAQRCWSRAHAIAKTRDKPVRLTDSEPAHLLAAMARRPGFAALVCLVGGGQEIHDGEGGLAEWGTALRAAEADRWLVRAAPDILSNADPRQRLGALPELVAVAALHLDVSIRQIRSASAADWVNHVLEGDAASACAVRSGASAFRITRSLADLRAHLRTQARGLRRAGLLASSGAKRLRAEGLGVELPHMEADAVAHWFLDRFPPDIRASDALETVATEFSCQGLELDYVGLCWDGDLIREPGRTAWRVRSFRGTRWQIPKNPEAIANQLNTYRVLLTRARYETAIFVPQGDHADPSRDPAIYNEITRFLLACGVQPLPSAMAEPEPDAAPRAREQARLL